MDVISILQDNLDHSLVALESYVAAPESPNVERVHKTRVALKRMRAVWRLLRGGKDKRSRTEIRVLGAAADALSAARERDVLPATFAWLRERLTDEHVDAARDQLPDIEEIEPVDPGGPLLRALAALRHSQLTLAVFLSEPDREGDVKAGLRRALRRCRQWRRKCLRRRRDTDWHGWRRRVKDLQYALEALFEPLPETLQALRAGLKSVADSLGQAHDIVVLLQAVHCADPDGAVPEEFYRQARGLTDSLYAEAAATAEPMFQADYRNWRECLKKQWKALTHRPDPDNGADTDLTP